MTGIVFTSRICSLLTTLALSGIAVARSAAQFAADSGPPRAALLELYTSEGCDGCLLVDRWVSELPSRGYNPAQVVELAFWPVTRSYASAPPARPK